MNSYCATQDGLDSFPFQAGSSIVRGREADITAVRCEDSISYSSAVGRAEEKPYRATTRRTADRGS
jgi:hypothetical protein